MHYVINVAKKQEKPAWNGKPRYLHLFATAEHSLPSESQARQLLAVFREKFPKPEYQLSLTRWEKRGHALVDDSTSSD